MPTPTKIIADEWIITDLLIIIDTFHRLNKKYLKKRVLIYERANLIVRNNNKSPITHANNNLEEKKTISKSYSSCNNNWVLIYVNYNNNNTKRINRKKILSNKIDFYSNFNKIFK